MEVVESAAGSQGFGDLAEPLQLALFLGGLVLVAGALVSLTAFTRIVIVLSFVRRALTTQEIPPNAVIIGLSMFLTLFVMGPTFESIHENALSKLINKEITATDAWEIASRDLRDFMLEQTRKRDLMLFMDIAEVQVESADELPMRILVPAFVISELKTAFIMGFCIYVPFLLIDLVVSTVLMSLGMMMMPPMIVSTPCKIMLFVLVDGWHLVALSLSQSFAVPG